jgi:hypothetical protein
MLKREAGAFAPASLVQDECGENAYTKGLYDPFKTAEPTPMEDANG